MMPDQLAYSATAANGDLYHWPSGADEFGLMESQVWKHQTTHIICRTGNGVLSPLSAAMAVVLCRMLWCI